MASDLKLKNGTESNSEFHEDMVVEKEIDYDQLCKEVRTLFKNKYNFFYLHHVFTCLFLCPKSLVFILFFYIFNLWKISTAIYSENIVKIVFLT